MRHVTAFPVWSRESIINLTAWSYLFSALSDTFVLCRESKTNGFQVGSCLGYEGPADPS